MPLIIYMAAIGSMTAPTGIWADMATTRPSSSPTVTILPLRTIGEAGHEWIGNAVQEGLASEMRKLGGTQASTAPTATANPPGEFLISGTIQFVEEQMRVDSQVVHSSDGKSVGNLRAEGNIRDLFNIEDRLAEEANRLLAPPKARTAASNITAATIGWTGSPTTYQPRYFDGDLSRTLAVPDRFSAESEKYNYRPTSFGYYGVGYGNLGYGGAILINSGSYFWGQQATPTSGW
ncbi:MAG: hypothetical protein M3O30_19140 [Planctomycetota bacterium]|nr:hypothetical protein [Planctomycetota bacterium]